MFWTLYTEISELSFHLNDCSIIIIVIFTIENDRKKVGKSVLQQKFTLDVHYTKNIIAILPESNSLVMVNTDYKSVVKNWTKVY